MAISLGKRKRPSSSLPSSSNPRPNLQQEASSSDTEGLAEVFRRHFEAKFKPLPESKKPAAAANVEAEQDLEANDSDDDDDDAHSWAGLSTEGETHDTHDTHADAEAQTGDRPAAAVQVVEHSVPARHNKASKAETKAFMSPKPPGPPRHTPSHTRRPAPAPAADGPDEATNLQHDASLQKLLRETQLLSSPQPGPDARAPLHSTGAQRHAALDLHLASLGARAAVALQHQQKMPMAVRRGIERARAGREARRREEARQMGVVLERAGAGGGKRAAASSGRRRDRGVGGPSVGRFSGGTLKLSSRDLSDIRGRGGGRRARGRGRR